MFGPTPLKLMLVSICVSNAPKLLPAFANVVQTLPVLEARPLCGVILTGVFHMLSVFRNFYNQTL